jgi:4-azaleucine resistance transporter AzlC
MIKELNLKDNIKFDTLKFAFKQSIPVMLGYLFLGIAFGLMLQNAGYHYIWALIISMFIYAGSMQFVLVTLLTGGVGLVSCAVMTLIINGRHIFYGLSFVEKFKKAGKYYPYMIFSLTDETYSILCALKVPKDLDENKVMFYISLLDQSYWIIGSILGALAGQFITFNTSGIEFSMTALFVVIFINQWRETPSHKSALIGLSCAIISLIVFGAKHFILPALSISVIIMILTQNLKKEKEDKEQ